MNYSLGLYEKAIPVGFDFPKMFHYNIFQPYIHMDNFPLHQEHLMMQVKIHYSKGI